MIYVDALMPCPPSRRWPWTEACHLFCGVGDVDALHSFARRLGLKRSWFQLDARLPHYDLTPGKRLQAVKQGAAEVGREFVVETMNRWREHKTRVEKPLLEFIHAAAEAATSEGAK